MGAQIKVEVIVNGAAYAYENIVYTENTGNSAGYTNSRRPYIISVDDGIILSSVRNVAEAYKYRVTGEFYSTAHPQDPYIPADPTPSSHWKLTGLIGAAHVVATTDFDIGGADCYAASGSYTPNGAIHLATLPYDSTPKIDLSLNLPTGSGVRVVGVMIDPVAEVVGVWIQSSTFIYTCYLISAAAATSGDLISTHPLNLSVLGSAVSFGFGQGASVSYTAMHFDFASMTFAYAQGALSRALGIGVLDGAATRVLGYSINNQWQEFSYPSVFYRDGLVYAVCWDGANDVIAVLSEVMTATDVTTLRSIVEAECVSSNMLTLSDIDATALTQIVRGYKISSAGAIRGALEPLQASWPFDAVASGYIIKFILRGGASVSIVSSDDLGAAQPGEQGVVRITNSREMDIQLPRRVEVTYLDVEREYDIGEQFAERLNTDAINVMRLELPIVLNANEAAGKAEVLLYLFWLERNDLSFVLPPTFTNFEPGDVITVNAPGATHIARLTSHNYLPDGRLECSAKQASSSIYTSTAVGESGLSTGQVLTFSGNSVAELLDIPTIHDSYGTPGFMAGMRGTWPSWPSGLLVESSDGGQVWVTLQAFTQATASGYATDSIGAGVINAWDRKNVLSVTMLSGSLSSATEYVVLNRGNHFAYGAPGRWEIIGVNSVTAIDATHYTLRNLLRGRAGTEWAMTLHQVGDALIRLDDNALRFMDSVPSAIDVAKLYKAVSNNQTLDAAVTESFAYSGVNLEPLSPVFPKGSRDANNDWTLRCTRRTRIDGELRDYVDVPLGETTEAYRWLIYNSTYATLKRTVDTTTPALVYTNAQQTADFGGVIDLVYFDVAQLSSTVGAGRALRTVVAIPEVFQILPEASLLMYFNGSNGSTSFIDSASPANTITYSGSVQLSTTYSLSGGSSLSTTGGGHLIVAHDAWMDGGANPWTLEFFAYEPSVVSTFGSIVSRRDNSGVYCPWQLSRFTSTEYRLFVGNAGNNNWVASPVLAGVNVVAGTWQHIALVFTGTKFIFFVGGVKSSTETTISSVATTTQPIYVGRGDTTWSGYMEDLRYTPGSALYTANFTPPTSPLPP